jgi:hypothetical protein
MFARTIDGFTALHQVVKCQSPFRVWFQEHDQISSRCNIVDFLLEEIWQKYGFDMLVWFVNTTDILNQSLLRYIAEEGCVDILRQLLGKCCLHRMSILLTLMVLHHSIWLFKMDTQVW